MRINFRQNSLNLCAVTVYNSDPCTDWQILPQGFHRHLLPLEVECAAVLGSPKAQLGVADLKSAQTCHNTNPDRPNKHCKIARGEKGGAQSFGTLAEDFCLHNSTSWLCELASMPSAGYSIQSLLQNDDEPKPKVPKITDKKPNPAVQLPLNVNPLAAMMLQERLFGRRK